MKKLIVKLFKWIASLFAKKVIEEKTYVTPPNEAPIRTRHPVTRVHNNRKRTKGRVLQVVGRRTIYHGAK